MSLVLREDHGPVVVLTLNRPDARNALNAALREDLIAALQGAASEGHVGCIVLTGAGKCFAAGADVKELLARSVDEQRAFISPPHMYSVIEGLRVPVIAALNGHALGAGLELATACDYRIAAPHAKVGQPEINLAIIPGGGGTQRLRRLIGMGPAAKMVYTGHLVAASDAPTGLIDQLDDDPVAAALALGAMIGEQDHNALEQAKRALQAGGDYADGLQTEIDAFMACFSEPEMRARIQAFLD